MYMVNPSGLPKKSKKNNKSKRRNPELLIVNPYSLEDHDEQKKRAKMAKRKRKSKKSRSRRSKRKNPLARRRRRNPDLGMIKDQFLGPELGNVKKAAMMAVGGGMALAVGTAAFGARLGSGAIGKGLVAMLSGVIGGVVVSKLGEMLVPGNAMVQELAVNGAIGAMVLGVWALAQPVVEPWADTLNARLGFAGLGAWTKEFDGLGQAYYDEFTTGVAPGMDGYFGQPVIAATDLTDPADNPFLSGYEPLGDIYNSQRLGSFEAESGLGGFVPETANPRDQQVADEMKHAAGHYGGYEGTLFEPFIED